MGSALFLRLLAALLLIAHILLRALNPSTNLLVDLFLYNAVAATVFLISVLGADVKNRVGRYALSFAIFAWASGSILTSATEFYTLPGYLSLIHISEPTRPY